MIKQKCCTHLDHINPVALQIDELNQLNPSEFCDFCRGFMAGVQDIKQLIAIQTGQIDKLYTTPIEPPTGLSASR